VNFLKQVSEVLLKHKIKKVTIKQCPYFDSYGIQENIFLKGGFLVQRLEIDSFIKVDEEYEQKLPSRKSRKLRSLKRSNLIAEQIPLSHLSEVYSFILNARQKKNYDLSLCFEEVQKIASAFPDRVFLFSVKDEERMVAASICLRVKKDWLYDFYHDHDAAYDAESPLVLLMDLIYEFCGNSSIHWIELGTSMSGDQVNEGLLTFKEGLGGREIRKITFEKILTG
jgi:hypothetical protein